MGVKGAQRAENPTKDLCMFSALNCRTRWNNLSIPHAAMFDNAFDSLLSLVSSFHSKVFFTYGRSALWCCYGDFWQWTIKSTCKPATNKHICKYLATIFQLKEEPEIRYHIIPRENRVMAILRILHVCLALESNPLTETDVNSAQVGRHWH